MSWHRRHRASSAIPIITDETLEPLDPVDHRPRRHRRHRHPHGQRRSAATRSDNWRAPPARRWSTAASTRRCFPRRRATSAARTPSSRATATWSGRGCSTTAAAGRCAPVYEGGQVEPEDLLPARWDLMPEGRYMWASVQTVRGCPKHCSFCSVWKTDGQRPRQRVSDVVIEEVVALRRRGLPVHRAGGRQLLSGDADRSADGRRGARTRRSSRR